MTLSGAMRSAVVALGATVVSAESGAQVVKLPAALPRYDCHAEYEMWKTAWGADWKAWCCENEARGCPSTSTSTATTTTRTATATSTETTTTTEGEGCEAMCEFARVNATCGQRVNWAAQYETAERQRPCEAARALVLSQCSICGGCSLKAADCDSEEHENEEEEEEASEDSDEHEDEEEAKEGAKITFRKAPAAMKSMFRKKFAESPVVNSQSASGALGFFARCSLAGIAAGVPLLIVLRRSLRTAPGQPELRQQIYEQAGVQGDEVEARD